MAADAPARRHRSVEDQSPSRARGRFHFRRQLVHERIERHRMARRKISLEQIARVHSLRRRAETRRETLELATDIKDDKTREKFVRNGWRFRAPHDLSADYRLYRDYIRRSKGEFTVAKDQYVRLNTGWFSDRSACYLAAGRPVITQETGFTKTYGGKLGLLSFRSLAEIVDAVKKINADYAKHSRATRTLAREFFEAENVVKSILDRAGI